MTKYRCGIFVMPAVTITVHSRICLLNAAMFKNYLTIAVRNLWKRKLYTLINMSGLVLGITCSLVIYVFISYELGFDHFHSKPGNIYRVVEDHTTADATQHWNTTAYPLAAAMRNDFPELEVTQTAGPLHFVVSAGQNEALHRFDEDKVLFTDAHFFNLFDFKKLYADNNDMWVAGDAKAAFINPSSVILTAGAAARYFPATTQMASLVGKSITIDNGDLKKGLTITGIIQNMPGNSSLQFTMLVNYEIFRENFKYQAGNWSGNYQGNTFVMLPGNTPPSAIEARLPGFKRKYLNPQDDKIIRYFLQPLNNIHTDGFYGETPGSYITSKTTLWALAGLGAFLILIASFNFINLSTALSIQRSKEVGIRKVVGGTRTQLFTQFMTEMVLITFLSLLIALALLYGLLSLINQNFGIINLQLHAGQNIFVFGFVLVVVLSLLAGCYPALVLSGFKPIYVLKNKFTKAKSGFSFRQGLIVLQFSIAFFLLVCTAVVIMQVNYFMHKDLGFAKDAVITINIPSQDAGKLEVLRQQLLRNPNVQQLSYASGAPTSTSGHYGTNFRLREEPVSMMRGAEMKVVDLHYSNLYNLQMLAGRWLNAADTIPEPQDGINGFVVNEALVKMLGLTPATALGKNIIINEGEAPVIGVVKDFNNNALQEGIAPCLLFYRGVDFFGEAGIQLRADGGNTSTMSQTLAFIENTWKQFFPESIYKYSFLDDALAKSYLVESMTAKAFRLFAGIAIFISCLGLLGLVVFAAAQRQREIGVRKVLGATVTSIVMLLSKDFLKPVLAAICLASPAAWFASHAWLQGFAYRINISWWLFVVAGAAIIIIALVTMGIRAVKAAVANPVKSLRSE